MKLTGFTYDYVSISPARQIGEHAHPQWELSHVICGGGIRTIGDCTAPMEDGEIILVPPNIPHVWRFDPAVTDVDGNISNISVFFSTELLDGLAALFPELSAMVNRIKLQHEAVSYKGRAYEYIRALLLAMRGLTSLARLPKFMELLQAVSDLDDCESAGRNNVLSRAEERFEKVRVYCNCNYARHISLEDMAAYVGMNKSAFCTFMRKHAGVTLSEFVNDIRLRRAQEMLEHTDDSISSIAYNIGFSNVTYFNRLFRNRYGCTPKEMRMVKQ